MSTYKLKKELPKEFKIKVNQDQSKALQEHLFENGYSWFGGDVRLQYLDAEYLELENASLCRYVSKKNFKESYIPKIRFKDYFEKVEDNFPEKWCILVTEDNYKELDVYLQLNKYKYNDFGDEWNVKNPTTYQKDNYYFVNETKQGGHSKFGIPNDHTIITTEQFRAKYGDLKPKDIEFVISKDVEFDDSKEQGVIVLEYRKIKSKNEKLIAENQNLKLINDNLTKKLDQILNNIIINP